MTCDKCNGKKIIDVRIRTHTFIYAGGEKHKLMSEAAICRGGVMYDCMGCGYRIIRYDDGEIVEV